MSKNANPGDKNVNLLHKKNTLLDEETIFAAQNLLKRVKNVIKDKHAVNIKAKIKNPDIYQKFL